MPKPLTPFDKLPDWITVKEAGQLLRLKDTAMYERLRTGEIAARRFGRVWRIPKSALRPEIKE